MTSGPWSTFSIGNVHAKHGDRDASLLPSYTWRGTPLPLAAKSKRPGANDHIRTCLPTRDLRSTCWLLLGTPVCPGIDLSLACRVRAARVRVALFAQPLPWLPRGHRRGQSGLGRASRREPSSRRGRADGRTDGRMNGYACMHACTPALMRTRVRACSLKPR